jgi:hypothetical protein
VSEERIGSILISMGAIDEATLQHALSEQRQATLRLTGGGRRVRQQSGLEGAPSADPDEVVTLRLPDEAPQADPASGAAPQPGETWWE